MPTRDSHLREEKSHQRRRTPLFSSTLLDNIYHSIDETKGAIKEPKQEQFDRRDNDLRRAIMIEKWMENYSTDSSMFSSSGTDSSSSAVSRSTPKPSAENVKSYETARKCEETGRFTRTKSRALKIYGELKKVKQPISPGRKISSFLNSIFSSRNLRKNQAIEEDWCCSLRKSKSAKDSTTTCTSRSCLSKAPSPRSKSKRSVRFGPVSVIIDDEDRTPFVYDNDVTLAPNISSRFIKENISSLRSYKDMNLNKYEFDGLDTRENANNKDNDNDNDNNNNEDDGDDDKSCTSSDLFELENIGVVGNGTHREELPVYGTTSLKFNQAISFGLFR